VKGLGVTQPLGLDQATLTVQVRFSFVEVAGARQERGALGDRPKPGSAAIAARAAGQDRHAIHQ
jgi:hypothetical protein